MVSWLRRIQNYPCSPCVTTLGDSILSPDYHCPLLLLNTKSQCKTHPLSDPLFLLLLMVPFCFRFKLSHYLLLAPFYWFSHSAMPRLLYCSFKTHLTFVYSQGVTCFNFTLCLSVMCCQGPWEPQGARLETESSICSLLCFLYAWPFTWCCN